MHRLSFAWLIVFSGLAGCTFAADDELVCGERCDDVGPPEVDFDVYLVHAKGYTTGGVWPDFGCGTLDECRVYAVVQSPDGREYQTGRDRGAEAFWLERLDSMKPAEVVGEWTIDVYDHNWVTADEHLLSCAFTLDGSELLRGSAVATGDRGHCVRPNLDGERGGLVTFGFRSVDRLPVRIVNRCETLAAVELSHGIDKESTVLMGLDDAFDPLPTTFHGEAYLGGKISFAYYDGETLFAGSGVYRGAPEMVITENCRLATPG